ncbi:reverse transcriptase domain-containing protein [Tanacetum coccineum]
MHTRASNSGLVEPLSKPEHTLNRRLRRRNRRVPFERRDERPAQPRIVYLPILDINYFRHFLDILKNYNPMDDEPIWVADRVVAPTPGSIITIPETANKFAIKANHMTLVKGNQFDDTFMDLKTKLETTTKNHQASIQNLEAKFDRFADKQSARPSGSLPSNTQPNPKGSSSKPYQPPQAQNEHVNAVFTRSGKSYDPPINQNDQQNDYETHMNFDNEDEEEESTPQPESQTPKPIKETPMPKHLRKEKMEAQCGKLLDMIRAVRINVPLVDVLARMLNYGKFLKELVSNKHKLEQISSAFPSNESFAMIQNKVPPKLGDPRSFLIPCTFSKAFSCNALADLGASINLIPYSLYAKLSLETLKLTKMSVGKFTFPVDFVILEKEEESKVPLILGRPFLHTVDVVIRVKQKNSILDIDVINEILEEDFDALLDEGEDTEYETKEPQFEKIIFNTGYKIKTSLEEPPSDLELKPLPDHLEYVLLEEPIFFPVIISSQLSEQNKRKCHFMVKEGIVLGHKVSGTGLEVNKVKINVISKLPPPTNVKGIRSFLGHASFYRCFIKDFSKIARPLTKLLEKDTPFKFNDECDKAFNSLKEKITFGAVLGQKDGKHFHPIYFASKTLNAPQQKYIVTEKELIAVQDAKPSLIHWILLLQEFDIEMKTKKGIENVAADHLSQIDNDETSDDSEVDDSFPGKILMKITTRDIPWFVDFANYLVGDIIPKGMTYQQKNKFFSDLKNYFWEDPYLFKVCSDGVIRRYVSGPETRTILDQCHHGPTGGCYGPSTTPKKVLDLGFYWPTIIKEAQTLVCLCEACQKTRNISKRDEMSLNSI